jgi:large subunit ribosomal protein L28
MARCQLCNKAGQSGNNVSHSNKRTRTRWFANVQRSTIIRDGKPVKMYVCTRCLRTHNKAIMKG